MKMELEVEWDLQNKHREDTDKNEDKDTTNYYSRIYTNGSIIKQINLTLI